MGTRCDIVFFTRNGRVFVLRVHCDGYPDGVGKTLVQKYGTASSAEDLVREWTYLSSLPPCEPTRDTRRKESDDAFCTKGDFEDFYDFGDADYTYTFDNTPDGAQKWTVKHHWDDTEVIDLDVYKKDVNKRTSADDSKSTLEQDDPKKQRTNEATKVIVATMLTTCTFPKGTLVVNFRDIDMMELSQHQETTPTIMSQYMHFAKGCADKMGHVHGLKTDQDQAPHVLSALWADTTEFERKFFMLEAGIFDKGYAAGAVRKIILDTMDHYELTKAVILLPLRVCKSTAMYALQADYVALSEDKTRIHKPLEQSMETAWETVQRSKKDEEWSPGTKINGVPGTLSWTDFCKRFLN